MNENFSKSKTKRKSEQMEYECRSEKEKLKQLKQILKQKGYSKIPEVIEEMNKNSLIFEKYKVEKYISIPFMSPFETSLIDIHCSTKFLSIDEIKYLINVVEQSHEDSEKKAYAKYVLSLVKLSLERIISDALE